MGSYSREVMSPHSNARLELIVASQSDRSTISNLIQLYLYDMASDVPFPVGKDGTYEYAMLEDFWEHPYLFMVDGNLAGFALVISHCPITTISPCWFMAEFFVLRPYRRQGIGRNVFGALKDRHPGLWHIATTSHNHPAERFWSSVTSSTACATTRASFDDMNWTVRLFRTS